MDRGAATRARSHTLAYARMRPRRLFDPNFGSEWKTLLVGHGWRYQKISISAPRVALKPPAAELSLTNHWAKNVLPMSPALSGRDFLKVA